MSVTRWRRCLIVTSVRHHYREVWSRKVSVDRHRSDSHKAYIINASVFCIYLESLSFYTKKSWSQFRFFVVFIVNCFHFVFAHLPCHLQVVGLVSSCLLLVVLFAIGPLFEQLPKVNCADNYGFRPISDRSPSVIQKDISRNDITLC